MAARGLVESEAKARAVILAGQVQVFHPKSKKPYPNRIIKAGTLFPEDSEISIQNLPRYVSRGGEKLEAAVKKWGIRVEGEICLDVGSSTGGFSDCLLQHGAKAVYCVDVGRGQLHPKIRNDSRVQAFEETHFLNWKPHWDQGVPTLAVVDVSFISLEKILFRMYEVGGPDFRVLALIKPQFEVSPKFVRKGIVRDPQERENAVQKILGSARRAGFTVLEHFSCPVLGAKGNQEEWTHLLKQK